MARQASESSAAEPGRSGTGAGAGGDASPGARRPRLLIVDDDEALRVLLSKVAEEEEWEADCFDSAESALPALVSTSYDVALLDRMLPGMDGIGLLREIKKVAPGTEVIIMTAYVDTASLIEAIGAGIYDYLVKPFQPLGDVILTVQRALEKATMVRENSELIVQLTEANHRISAMNEDLEAKVVERTQQLERLSLTDDVTGLYNQRYLFVHLRDEIRRARRYKHPLSVMMLDIDHFKNVNDSHDHLFGSAVLRRVGEILLGALRDVDKVVRYGGDEFVVTMPETTRPGALLAAERVRSAIAATDVGVRDDPYRLTVSIGIAEAGECEAKDEKALLQAADRAMYAAKEGGRDRVFASIGCELVPFGL